MGRGRRAHTSWKKSPHKWVDEPTQAGRYAYTSGKVAHTWEEEPTNVVRVSYIGIDGSVC